MAVTDIYDPRTTADIVTTSITTDTISEKTSGNGVAVDGLAIKDYGLTISLADSGKIKVTSASSAASASGLILGGGTSLAPVSTSTADAKFIELRCKSTATSGDNRLFYGRYDLGGAGGGGECIRGLTALTAANGTAHGGHLGISVSDTGYVTGLAAGSRGTLEISDAAVPANGSYYGGYIEIYSDGTSSSLAAATQHAILFLGATGDATGLQAVKNVFSISGDSGTAITHMIETTSLAELPTGTVGLSILVNGAQYFIPAVVAAQWN